MAKKRVILMLGGALFVAAALAAQLVEERICPRTVCFVTDRGKVIPMEDPIEKYPDKRWLQIRYESLGRPRLSIAPAVRNLRAVASSTTTYDDQDEQVTTTEEEPIIPIAGLEDLLVDALLRTKLFDVLERVAIDEVYREQDFSKGVLANLTPGQYIAIATVSELAETQRASTRGVKTALGRIGLGRDKSKVVVAVRIVDVASGKVVQTALESAALSGWSGQVREDAGDESSEDEEEGAETEFASSGLVSKAVGCALNKAMFKVAQWAAQTPWWSAIIKVQQEDPNIFLYTAGGRQQGVEEGMQLAVWSHGEELRHPVTDEVLGYDRIRLGTAVVLDVREQFAIAKAVEVSPDVQVGDQVELMGGQSTAE